MRVTPRAALIFKASPGQSLKYLYGNAFRAPNAYELNTYFFGPQVLTLRPESIDTHELVWERYAHDWLRTSVSAYWYKADRLITLVDDPSTSIGSSYVNLGQVRAKGLEFEAQMRLRRGGQAVVRYALQDAEDQTTHARHANGARRRSGARESVSGSPRGDAPRIRAQRRARARVGESEGRRPSDKTMIRSTSAPATDPPCRSRNRACDSPGHSRIPRQVPA